MHYKESKNHNQFVNVSFIDANENQIQEKIRATFNKLIKNNANEDVCITTAYPGNSIYSLAVKKWLVKDELKYLKSVLSSRYWKIYNFNDFDYMNNIVIPSEKLFPIIMKEVKKNYNHLKTSLLERIKKIRK